MNPRSSRAVSGIGLQHATKVLPPVRLRMHLRQSSERGDIAREDAFKPASAAKNDHELSPAFLRVEKWGAHGFFGAFHTDKDSNIGDAFLVSRGSSGITKDTVQNALTVGTCVVWDKRQNIFSGIIQKAAHKYDLDPALLSSVIEAESGFNPDATSKAGAMGLMQLMPETAKELGVKNPFDPSENIMAGAGYLKMLLNRYGGELNLALAATWGMETGKSPRSCPAKQ